MTLVPTKKGKAQSWGQPAPSRSASPSRQSRWLPIERTGGRYEVSDRGEIRNAETLYVLKLHPNPGGYLGTTLSFDGKFVTVRVHREVALAFLPAPMEGQDEVNHKDLVKTNNAVENLEWCSREQNQLHFYEATSGEKYRRGMRVIDPKEYTKIRKAIRAGSSTQAELAREYGVSETTITRIKKDGRAHIGLPRGSKCSWSKLTENEVRSIRALEGKMLQSEIADKFGVSAATVHVILRRKKWAWLDDEGAA